MSTQSHPSSGARPASAQENGTNQCSRNTTLFDQWYSSDLVWDIRLEHCAPLGRDMKWNEMNTMNHASECQTLCCAWARSVQDIQQCFSRLAMWGTGKPAPEKWVVADRFWIRWTRLKKGSADMLSNASCLAYSACIFCIILPNLPNLPEHTEALGGFHKWWYP